MRVPSASPEAAASTVGHALHATVVNAVSAVQGKGSARSAVLRRGLQDEADLRKRPMTLVLLEPSKVRCRDSQAVGDVTKACLVYNLFAIMASPSCAAKYERSHHSHLLQAPAAAH